jgi:hypothetical protein
MQGFAQTVRQIIMPTSHSPPPWSVEQLEACLVVKDSGGQKLAYVSYEEDPGRRRIAANVAKLPEPLWKR